MRLDGFDKNEPRCSCVFETESDEHPSFATDCLIKVYLPVGENGKRLGRIPFSCIPLLYARRGIPELGGTKDLTDGSFKA